MNYPIVDLETAIGLVPDGALIALTKRTPIAGVRELIRQGRSGLRVIGIPTAGFGVDLLIGAGVVRSLESGAVYLDEIGVGPSFDRAFRLGQLEMIESACPIIEMALQAGASGLPFTAVPGVIGSDLANQRNDFRIISDPFDEQRRIMVVPSIKPDIALIHGSRADAQGNIVIDIDGDERIAVQASDIVIAVVEEIRDDAIRTLMPTEQVLPAIYFDAIACVEHAMFPLGYSHRYPPAHHEIARYVRSAQGGLQGSEYMEQILSQSESDYLGRFSTERSGV